MLTRFELFSMACFNFNKYWNQLASEEMKKYDLKGAYALYFVTLYHYEGDMTVARLSEMCGKDKADISRAVSTMEKRGMLIRVGANAYRAKLVLTELGTEIAQAIYERAAALVNQAGEGLSEPERETFFRALALITNNLKAMCADRKDV